MLKEITIATVLTLTFAVNSHAQSGNSMLSGVFEELENKQFNPNATKTNRQKSRLNEFCHGVRKVAQRQNSRQNDAKANAFCQCNTELAYNNLKSNEIDMYLVGMEARLKNSKGLINRNEVERRTMVVAGKLGWTTEQEANRYFHLISRIAKSAAAYSNNLPYAQCKLYR